MDIEGMRMDVEWTSDRRLMDIEWTSNGPRKGANWALNECQMEVEWRRAETCLFFVCPAAHDAGYGFPARGRSALLCACALLARGGANAAPCAGALRQFAATPQRQPCSKSESSSWCASGILVVRPSLGECAGGLRRQWRNCFNGGLIKMLA